MSNDIEVLDGEIVDEIRPEKGDIVRNVRSGVEYVFYGISTKYVQGERLDYPTWLMQEPTGKLSEPMVVFGGWDVIKFVERGAPREPGEKPVRNLTMPANPSQSTVTAADGRLP